MTWFRCGGIPVTLKNAMNAVLNKKFGTSSQNYPPNGWPDDVNLMGPLPVKSASGAIASFSDGADEVPVKNWLVTLPASLSGYSEVNAVRSGKNLASGGVYEYNARNMIIAPVYLRAGTYTASFSRGVNVQYIYIRKGETVSLVGDAYDTKSNSTFFTFTADEDTYYYAQLYRTNTSETWEDYPVTQPQIEVGSTATAYEAYEAPTQYTASLGLTIYGGTADIVTGEGEDGEVKIKFKELTWTYNQQYGRFEANGLTSVIKTPSSNNVPLDGLIAEGYVTTVASSGSAQDRGIAVTTVSGYVFVYDSRYTDVTTFLSVEGEKYIVYPLATPTPFTFTPITADTELGTNNFWADEGDSEVTYRADIDLALNALQGSRSLSASLMRSESPEEVSEPEEIIQNTEEQEGENDER